MPGKDMSRWQQSGDGTWVRRLSATTEVGVRATQTAIDAAEKLGVDLTKVEGSGKDGRITKTDVEAHACE